MKSPLPPEPQVPGDLGVDVLRAAEGFCVQPLVRGRADVRYAPCPFPKIPVSLLYLCAGVGRGLWQQTQSQMVLLLALDLASGTWSHVVPPQRCGSWGVSCRLGREHLPELTPTMRIAGSFWSGRYQDLQPLETHLPPMDGLHVLVDPELFLFHGMHFLRCEGRLLHLPWEALVAHECDALLAAALPRLQIVEVL